MDHSDVRVTKKYARILTENLRAVIEGKEKIVKEKYQNSEGGFR